MNDHIMLDLETLGTGRNSVILSIGAIRFDPYADTALECEPFYVEFDKHGLALQQRMGLNIDARTVEWWMRQSVLARRVFEPAFPKDPVQALQDFAEYVEQVPKTKIWGNGADFDNVLLGDMYEAFSVVRPWSYSRNRCFRTLKGLPGAPKLLHRYGVQHNGRDDAITQAQHLQEIYKWLRLTPQNSENT